MILLTLMSASLAADPWIRPIASDWGGTLSWEGDRIVYASGSGAITTFDDQGQRLAGWETHKWGVSSVSVSADGRRVLTVDYKGRVEVHEADTGDRLVRWKGGSRWSSPAAVIAPDGRTVLYAEDQVELRSVEGGEARVLWEATPTTPDLMGFYGDHIYTPADYTGLRLWDTSGQSAGPRVPLVDGPNQLRAVEGAIYHVTWEGKLLRVDPEGGSAERVSVPGFAGEPYAFSPDGRLLAFLVADSEIHPAVLSFWDLEAERSLGSIAATADGVTAFAFSPDSQQVAVLGASSLRVLDVPDPEAAVQGGKRQIPLSIGVTEDGQKLVAVYGDGGVRTWWVEGGELAGELQLPIAGSGWTPAPAALRPGARELAFLDNNGALVVWDLAEGARKAMLLPETEGDVELHYALDGSLGVVSYDKATLFDPEGVLVGQVSFGDSDELAVAPGGQALALSSWSGDVSLLDADGSIRWTKKVSSDYVMGLHFLPDGTLLVLDMRGEPTLLDAEGEKLSVGPALRIEAGGMEEVNASALSPDGAVLFVSGEEGDLIRRQLPDGQWRGELVHSWPWEYLLGYGHLAPLPDGRRVVTADRVGALQLWDVNEDGAPALVRTYAGPAPGALAITGDAERVFIARAEGLIEVRARGGDEITRFKLDTEVMDLALNPEGTRLAVALADGGVMMMPAMGGEPLWQLSLFEWVARGVDFSPDGQTLAAIDDVGNVALLQVESGDPVPRYSPPWWVSGLAWDDEGRFVTHSGSEGLLTWNGQAWERRKLRRRQAWEIDGALASCDGRILLNASGFDSDPVPAYYSTKQGTGGRLQASAQTRLPSEALRCDGGVVVLAAPSGDAWALDAEDGALLSVLPGDGSALTDLEVLPDGAVLTTSVAGSARLWRPREGGPVQEWLVMDETEPPPPPLPPALELPTEGVDEALPGQLVPGGVLKVIGTTGGSGAELDEILSDPETLQRIDEVLRGVGGVTTQPPPSTPTEDDGASGGGAARKPPGPE